MTDSGLFTQPHSKISFAAYGGKRNFTLPPFPTNTYFYGNLKPNCRKMPANTRISLLCISLLFSAALPKAQSPCAPNPFGFQHLNRSSGLLSAVDALTQDHLGFWWVGMGSGLQRFNGKSFQTFRHQPGDSTSLPDNRVLALHADKHQRIWVASDFGISCYLPKNGGFKTYKIFTRGTR